VSVLPVIAVVFVGAFGGPGIVLAGKAPVASVPEPAAARWTDVRLVAELRDKDTVKIDVITAGEEQQSSFDQCLASADVVLCRILVSAVNVAAVIGTSIPGN
jgi:hypothetical protein